MRVLGSWGITAVIVLALAAPAVAQFQPALGRDTLVIGAPDEPRGLNPLFEASEASAASAFYDIIPVLFTGNVQRDAAWRPFPQGVESLPSLRSGTWTVEGERMTLRWKIKPRNWHDGHRVTCADFVFRHRLESDDRVGQRGELTDRIANVSCPKGAGGLEVAVAWTGRFAYANLTVVGGRHLPRHLLEASYRANPSTLRMAPFGNDPHQTIGDGPYRLVEWQKGVSLTVEAVPNHPIFGTPKLGRIIWKFSTDQEALVSEMQAGTIDAMLGRSLSLRQAIDLERETQGRVKLYTPLSLSWTHIDFNLDNPMLKDVRVRRAIAHGVNRTQIVQQVHFGRAPVVHSFVPPQQPGYVDDVQKYPYDPARARALLREAGFGPGPDGIMRDVAGRRLALEISTTAGQPGRELIERIIQDQLRQVGIEITIVNFPVRVFFPEILGRRKFTGLALYNWNFGPTSDCDALYTSDGIPSERNGWTGQNYPGYQNAEMDRICKAISREVEEGERNRLLNESAHIFARDLPALPLNFLPIGGVAKAGLRNFALAGHSTTWNAHQWYWE